jgi:membrane protein
MRRGNWASAFIQGEISLLPSAWQFEDHDAMWVRAWNIFDRLFFGPRSAGPGLGSAVVRVLRYPYAVIRDLFGGEINLRAMGLVYTTLLSLIPLLAISFAILAAFGESRDLEPIVYEFFRPMGNSGATEITSRVMHFVGRVSNRVVGTVGLAVLLWTLVGTIKKVEDSFNFVWRVEHARSFARRLTEYVSLLIIGPILMVGFLALSHAALRSIPLQDVVNLAPLARLRGVGINLAPYVMVTAFFVVLYMFIPNTRVRVWPALIGAATAGFLWATVGKVFTNMVVLSTRLTIVYAGFAFIVAALLWTYFGWLILLAGAQLSFYIQNPSYLRLGLRELRLSNVEIEQLALKLMYCIGRARLQGTENWNVRRLAAEFGLPGIAVTRIACALEAAGLLKVSHDDECTLARAADTIAVQDILSVVRNQKSGDFVARKAPVPAVDALNKRLESAWRAACANETLQDLIAQPAAAPRLVTADRHVLNEH